MFRFRWLLPLGFALTAQGVFAQPVTKVTYRTVAVPAEVAIKGLSDKAGVPLWIAPTLFDKTLLIDVKDAPLKDVMDRLAYSCDGLWEPSGNGWRLVRDEEKRKALQIAADARELESITKQLAKITGSGQQTTPFDQAAAQKFARSVQQVREDSSQPDPGVSVWKRISDLGKQSPSGRLMARLVVSLDPKELQKLKEGNRIVYSSLPTAMQKRMPASLNAAIADFVREQNLWASVAEQTFPQQDDQGGGGYYIAPLQDRGRADKLAKVLLAVTHQQFGSYSIHMMAADAKGHIISRGDENFSAQFSEEDERMMSQPPKADPNEKPIEIAPLSKELTKALGNGNIYESRGIVPTLSPALREAMLNPEKVDPLSFATSDILFGIGAQTHSNIVANVPDYLFFLNIDNPGMKMDRPSAFFQITKMMKIEAEVKDGWFVVHPGTSPFTTVSLINRKALGPLLRNIVKKGRLTLDDAATYALSAPGQGMDFIGSIYLSCFDPTARQLIDENSRDMLQFYATLSPYQRQAAQRQQPISFQSLSPLQRTILERLVYGTDNSPLQVVSDIPETEGAPMDEMNDWDSLNRESTECLPRGLPSTGSFTIESVTDQVVSPVEDNQGETGRIMYGNNGELSVDDLAMQIFAKERPDLFPWMTGENGEQRNLDKLRIGSRLQVNFSFTFTPTVVMTNQLKELNLSTTTVSYANLPADLKSKIQAAVEKMRKDYKDVKSDSDTAGQGGGTGVKPPPPIR